jgi:hypothetical protein
MPKAGIVHIRLRPDEAREMWQWLRRRWPTVLAGRWASVSNLLEAPYDTHLLERKFRLIAARKRNVASSQEVSVQILRADALWLASRYLHNPSFLGARRFRPQNFPIINGVCGKCLVATRTTRGRRTLTLDEVEASMHRGGADERNVKRLRKRRREEIARQQRSARFGQLLLDAITGSAKST